jgi:hypothetical protein
LASGSSSKVGFELDLTHITSQYDPYDNSVQSCKDRYPQLEGNMLVAQLRRLYSKPDRITIPWFTASGTKVEELALIGRCSRG